MASGIYQIRNAVNEHCYIGSAKNLRRRKCEHFRYLAKHVHHNRYLQSAYDKYGGSSFVFEALVTCHSDMLLWYEQQFIDQWQPEYNLCLFAGNTLGVKCDDEKREKLSKAGMGKPSPRKGAVLSDETRRKLREAAAKQQRKGIPKSEETRRRMSEANKKRCTGVPRSKETRLKISLTKKARKG